MEFYRLSDGYLIPRIGLGTYQLQGVAGVRSMQAALASGYRLLDTAYNYENEGAVGRAIKASSVPRDQITVTSKLPGRYHAYDKALTAIQESLMRLDLDYIDLYLIHWPNPIEDHYVEAWQALIAAQQAGLVRSIGTSNFLPEHIDRLVKETGVRPVVNQLECHPHFNQAEVLPYHQEHHILVNAWSPLARMNKVEDYPELMAIAEKYNKTVPQIILRWHLDRGLLPIPRSSHNGRQAANLDVFDIHLTAAEREVINAFTRADGRQKDQDPATYQEF